MKYFVLAARVLIGGLFVYASFYKLLNPADFAVSVRNYLIVPSEYSNLIALTLPWIEMVAGVFLIAGIQTKPSAFLTSGMLAVFFGAIIYAYSIGLDIDCGCFSSAAQSKNKIGPLTIARDAAFLVISFLILALDKGDFSVSRIAAVKERPAVTNS